VVFLSSPSLPTRKLEDAGPDPEFTEIVKPTCGATRTAETGKRSSAPQLSRGKTVAQCIRKKEKEEDKAGHGL
jgi:hypothetical protein